MALCVFSTRWRVASLSQLVYLHILTLHRRFALRVWLDCGFTEAVVQCSMERKPDLTCLSGVNSTAQFLDLPEQTGRFTSVLRFI